MKKYKLIGMALSCLIFGNAQADLEISVSKDGFIQKMKTEYGFDESALKKLFKQTTVLQPILDAISRPAEKKLPWYKYRNIFIQDKRIKQGVEFWQKNRKKLQQAEDRFGIPAEIIIAIIGVETFYGRITGNYRVIDALNTLSFYYPERADFFRGEFEQFLLLTREQGFDPLELKGSYAGAMGIPQFISSSYRHYSIDFDGDDVIDIWNNPNDAIGSVANYFARHGWKTGKAVVAKVSVKGDGYKTIIGGGLRPDLTASELKSYGVVSDSVFDKGEKLKLFKYEFENKNEYWLAHNNFYVITRYNHSKLYAMVVYQLSLEIKKRMQQAEKNSN